MILKNINLGTGVGVGDGDKLHTAFTKINQNFANITSNVNSLSNSVTSVAGRTGNVTLTAQDIIGGATISELNTKANIISPTLVAPVLGAATATSINGLTITNSSGVLTIAAGKTLTANNTITLAGADLQSYTLPTTTAIIARTDSAQTFTGTQTFSNDVVVTGNITVNGTTSTINSATITVDDINIELGSVAVPTNATANGGGITLKGSTDKTIIWDSTNSNWTSSENWNLASSKFFKINNIEVLSASTLGSGVTASSLTSVGILTSLTLSGAISGITGGIAAPAFIDFNTTTTPAGAYGRLKWNDADGTIDIGLKGGNVTLQVGQEHVLYSLNNTGATLLNGQVVRVTGAQGSRATVALAQADAVSNSATVIGILTEDILNNQQGYVTLIGLVRDINTSAFVEGAVLYLSSTVAGGITSIRPTSPNSNVVVGFCVRSHSSLGSILVNTQNGDSLDTLHNVLITSVADKNILQYDSTQGVWKNAGPSTITAGNVTTNANLTGVVTSIGNATAINDAALSIAKTSGLQTALDSKQPIDAALTALAAGSDFVQFTGPATATKVFTLPNVSSTILVSGGALGTPSGGVATNITGLPTAGLVNAAVTYSKTKIKSLVALTDSAATLTATQMVDGTIFTITPTIARILTTDTGTAIVAAIPDAQTGTWFSILIVNTAAFDVTLAPGVGVTLGAGQGKHIINNVSGEWTGLVTGTTTVTIYRA